MTAPGGLIDRAERGELSAAELSHERHVELAFRYLQRYELTEAVARVEAVIRKVAADAGVPGKYHATITWAYCIVIAERMQAAPGIAWPAFRAANPDVFEPKLGLLLRYYPPERLMSDTARRQFVLPPAA